MIYRVKQFSDMRFDGTKCATHELMGVLSNEIQTDRKYRRLAKFGTAVVVLEETEEINILYGSAEYLRGVATLANVIGLKWDMVLKGETDSTAIKRLFK